MTKAKFIAFEKVRKSGLTNMYDINAVRLIAIKYGEILSSKDCFDIMLNYDKYKIKYGSTNNKKH
ncbi:MAG: hypothetical protein A2259_00695 [Candidatus Moranbacteria bacterium RIFOXYA2_FULL_43_15]|nr:MAG: hypothetical protein A2259_00695 [Candidatus Moranbacteria bacterium RIFOXYA2_FULL_43_15]